MPKTSMSKMTATRLRIILLSSVLILIIASAGLIVLGRQVITSYGTEVASAVSVSSSDEKTLRDLEVVSKSLEQQKPVVEKSKRIIADKTKTYAYQNQIIQDITRYAAMANIQIAGFAFSDGGGAAAGTGAAPAPAAATPATGGAAAIAAPAGLNPVNVTVTFAGATSYKTLYKFLQLLEGNLLRMEVDGLNLARPGGTEASSGIASLTIRIYTTK